MNKFQPKVSIITCVYNGVDYIEKTIQSVISQSYKNIQYIVIDGESTDGTLEVLNRYKHKIEVMVSEPDDGISDAMNKGISIATGEIIGLIHSDDWYEKDAVENAVSAFQSADIIYGDLLYWKSELPYFIYKGNHALLNREMTISHPSTFVKRIVFEEIGKFNKRYKLAMDYDFFVRALQKGVRFKRINHTLANFRYVGVSSKNWIKAYNEVRKIKNVYFGRRIANVFYFYFQVVKTSISLSLQFLGLNKIIESYRKVFGSIERSFR